MKDVVAGEFVAALLPLLGEGLFGGEGDLDGADDFGDVVEVDGCGGAGVEAGEDAVEVGWASVLTQLGCSFAETVAEAGLLGRGGE